MEIIYTTNSKRRVTFPSSNHEMATYKTAEECKCNKAAEGIIYTFRLFFLSSNFSSERV